MSVDQLEAGARLLEESDLLVDGVEVDAPSRITDLRHHLLGRGRLLILGGVAAGLLILLLVLRSGLLRLLHGNDLDRQRDPHPRLQIRTAPKDMLFHLGRRLLLVAPRAMPEHLVSRATHLVQNIAYLFTLSHLPWHWFNSVRQVRIGLGLQLINVVNGVLL